ncbi:MAG: metallophosphoesterase [Ottowia sp.]|nr:metallophosphoesterase [Ottowia sp.]
MYFKKWRAIFGRSIRGGVCAFIGIGILQGCSSITPMRVTPSDVYLKAAWVELGKDNIILARAITDKATCPTIQIDGIDQPMQIRASAATILPTRTSAQSKPAHFPVTSCERTIASGTRLLEIGARTLPLPKEEVNRIVVLGDTGCRIKNGVAQNCDDENAWPFARIAKISASLKPDLVVHVGDYHYRESPCPENSVGCKNSPWGYGWDTWDVDLFQPAAPLFAAAPWVVVRGNHEECARAGQGWFRFLDTQPYQTERSCDDAAFDLIGNYADTYAIDLGGHSQLIVFDSAKAGNQALIPDTPAFAKYQMQFQQASQLAAKPEMQSIFLAHHPILAFSEGLPLGGGNAALLSVMQYRYPLTYYPEGVQAAIHGHVHHFQAIDFSSNHPATFVAGNGGDSLAMVPQLDAPLAAPAAHAVVKAITYHNNFGFMVMDRQKNGDWLYTAYNDRGHVLTSCMQTGKHIHCDKTGRL